MAVTITPNLTDITLGEAADDGYWSGEDGYSTEVYRQGSSAQAWLVSKNASETASFDVFTKSGLVDMSATNTHIYVTMRCDIAPFIDYLRFSLQSDTTHGSATSGTYWWTLVDNTSVTEWYGEWKTFILDVNSTATDGDSTGTLDLSAITDFHINVDNSNSGNIRSIENTYVDCVRFGTGLTLTGTAWDFDDVATIDASNTYKWDVVRRVGPGIFEGNGTITIGNGATTTSPSISNQVLFFPDKSTAGEAGGPLGIIASAFYNFILDGTATTCDFNNMSLIASSAYPFYLDADYASLPASSIDWDGGVIVEASTVDLDDTQSVIGVSFVACGQINPSAAEFENNTISEYAGTDGALLWPGGTTVNNCLFYFNVRAIEITQASNQTFDALTFSGSIFDVHLNNGGTDIDVSKNNGSDPTNYIATGGGVVTFVGPSVTVKVTSQQADGAAVGSVMVLLKAKDGTGPFPFEESVTISNSGTTATVTHASHGMTTGDYVLIKDASLDDNNGVFQITVNTASEYEYIMGDTPGSSPTGDITSTFVALFGETNASTGVLSTPRVYPSDQPVTGYAAKASASPYWKRFPLVGTVDSADGVSLTAVMLPDT